MPPACQTLLTAGGNMAVLLRRGSSDEAGEYALFPLRQMSHLHDPGSDALLGVAKKES